MTVATSVRFRSVLGILTGFDILIALHGALFASVALNNLDTSLWSWSAWLLASAIFALPAIAIAAPLASWSLRSLSQGTRLIIAVVPIVFSVVLYLVAEVLRATQIP